MLDKAAVGLWKSIAAFCGSQQWFLAGSSNTADGDDHYTYGRKGSWKSLKTWRVKSQRQVTVAPGIFGTL